MNQAQFKKLTVLHDAASSATDNAQSVTELRLVMRLVLSILGGILIAISTPACSGQAFSSENYNEVGGQWSKDSGLTASIMSDAEIGGSSTVLETTEASTVAIAGSSALSATGGAASLSTGGERATGGTTASQDAGSCLCPNRSDCSPKGASCNMSTTALGSVSDKLTCIINELQCSDPKFNVYCYEC